MIDILASQLAALCRLFKKAVSKKILLYVFLKLRQNFVGTLDDGCEGTFERCFPIITIKHKLENASRFFSGFSQFPTSETLWRMCTNFRCSEFWDHLATTKQSRLSTQSKKSLRWKLVPSPVVVCGVGNWPFWGCLETECVLCQMALWDCFGGRILTQFPAQLRKSIQRSDIVRTVP